MNVFNLSVAEISYKGNYCNTGMNEKDMNSVDSFLTSY